MIEVISGVMTGVTGWVKSNRKIVRKKLVNMNKN